MSLHTDIYAKSESSGSKSESESVASKTGLSAAAIDEIRVNGLDPEQVSKWVHYLY